MTLAEIAKDHGYEDVDQAIAAMKFAGRWLDRNRGKAVPAHIQRAIDALVALQNERAIQQNGIRERIRNIGRNPIYFFGAITNNARFARARRFVRRALGLYLNFDRMVYHFAAIVPPSSGESWREAGEQERRQGLAEFANAANVIYGLNEQKKGALPSVVAAKALESLK